MIDLSCVRSAAEFDTPIGGPVAKLVEYSKRYDIAWIQKNRAEADRRPPMNTSPTPPPSPKLGTMGEIYESNPNLCIVFNKNRPSSRHYYPPG